MIYRTWAEVSLDNIAHNIKKIRGLIKPQTKLMAVVKADAYGHGVYEVSKVLLQNGADAFAVAFMDEAIQLRKYGINVPVLILGYTPVELAVDIVDYDLIPSIYNFSMAKAVSNAAMKRNKISKIHVKIDTGMSRIGFVYQDDEKVKEQTIKSILDIATMPNIEIEGIFTHFSCADGKDETLTFLQFERFMEIVKRLKEAGLNIPIKHVCNSAATMRYPHMHLDMVRVGIAAYGVYPSEEMEKSIKLLPAMQLKTTLINIKKVPANTPVGYGATYCTKEETIIGTIPIGYADGYSRLLSNKAEVIIRQKRVPIVGTICMDQCMINLSKVNNISVEDEVTVFGIDGAAQVSIEEVASWMGTINYELLCVIGKRVPRVYLVDGKVAGVINYLV
jgi:alanine racemase